MEIGQWNATAGTDRFSTSDEIRSALCFLPDFVVEYSNDELWEVESDLGGHVLIETADAEVLTLIEKLDPRAN